MKNPQKLTLIRGEFSLQDAREVLTTVFSGKLNFHNMKNFSSKERLGFDDKIAVKRIPQLKKSLEKIIKILEQAEKEGEQLSIQSDVIISFIKPKKTNEPKSTTRKSK